MTEQETNEIYSILVEQAGAVNDTLSRGEFCHFMNNSRASEFRFQGNLGFGGKFWKPQGIKGYRVDCYQEDMTEKETVIEKTNKALSKLSSRV